MANEPWAMRWNIAASLVLGALIRSVGGPWAQARGPHACKVWIKGGSNV